MNHRTQVGAKIFLYLLIIFFIVSVEIGVVFEFIVGPSLRWLLHNEPYVLPTFDRLHRWTKLVVWITSWCSVVMWFYERKSAGH